ncbi:hypothetical protein [Microvirga sp. 2MCAF38]|uniref:hypothetical protein n=1 Tax=Microvirga sp. 2MCAF38 TaxID=3232989 RepID=UPI003F96AC0C
MANGLTLFISTVLSAFGHADGADPNFQNAFAAYVIPQIIWLVIGLVREGRRAALSQNITSGAVATSEPQTTIALAERTDLASSQAHSSEQLFEATTPESASTQAAARKSSISGSKQFNNFIARHWRGEFPLWVSYWIFGFVANIACLAFATLIGAALSHANGYNPIGILATIVSVWLGLALILIWQLVGIWRSANGHINQKKSSIWAGLAKFAVLAGIARAAMEFGQSGYPQIVEASRMAFLDDPDIPAYSFRIMKNGTEVEVSGGFKYGLTDDFIRLLKAAPQVNVVHLNSDGGRLGEAERLYRAISSRGLITYSSSRCLSACTLAFAAGRERWLHANAKLGFHAPAFPGMSDTDLSDASQSQRTLMVASGIMSDFVSKALATPNRTMWYPTQDELLRARVVTGVADQYKFAVSGWGANLNRAQMEEQFTKNIPLFSTLKAVRPNDFAKLVDEFNAGYLNGETEGKLIDSAKAKVLPIISSYRPFADDQTLIDLGRLMVDQYKFLAFTDKQLCYEYASGANATRNYSAYLSAPLRQRELEISERILKTAASRQTISEKTVEPFWQIVGVRLATRFGSDKIQLLTQTDLTTAQRAQYCDMAIAMYEEILNLKDGNAAMVLRSNFQIPQ